MKPSGKSPRPAIDWADVRARLARAAAATEQAMRLSPQRAAAVLAERARQLARRPAQATAGEQVQAIAFMAGGARYAIEIRHVREVVGRGICTPLPGAPDFLLGLMNLRGALLAVFDLARLCGLNGAGREATARVLVLGEEQAEFGILADAVEDVAYLAVADLRPMPEGGGGQPFFRGVAPGALVLLDGAALLADDRLCIDQRDDV